MNIKLSKKLPLRITENPVYPTADTAFATESSAYTVNCQ